MAPPTFVPYHFTENMDIVPSSSSGACAGALQPPPSSDTVDFSRLPSVPSAAINNNQDILDTMLGPEVVYAFKNVNFGGNFPARVQTQVTILDSKKRINIASAELWDDDQHAFSLENMSPGTLLMPLSSLPASYADDDGLPLSKNILEHSRTVDLVWRSPHQFLSNVPELFSAQFSPLQPNKLIDIPSIYCALCVCLRHDMMFPPTSMLRPIVYPVRLNSTKQPSYNPLGRYNFKLLIDGCKRNVSIDDVLPLYGDGDGDEPTTLASITSTNPNEIWPCLFEKVLWKILDLGLYSDDPIHMMTGWLPERINLHSNSSIWKRLCTGHINGSVIATVSGASWNVAQGDGDDDDEGPRLIYPIIALHEIGDQKYALLSSPSCIRPDVLRTHCTISLNPAYWTSDVAKQLQDISAPTGGKSAGVNPMDYWVRWDDVVHAFSTLHCNWNVNRFTTYKYSHFHCTLPRDNSCDISNTTQYGIVTSSPSPSKLWVCVSIHSYKGRFTHVPMNVFAVSQDGGRRVYSYDVLEHSMASMEFNKGSSSYDVSGSMMIDVIAGQSACTLVFIPSVECNVTCVVYSVLKDNELVLQPVCAEPQSCNVETTGSWTESNNGGDDSADTYLNNPQFKLSVSRDCSVLLKLLPEHSMAPCHIRVFSTPDEGATIGTTVSCSTAYNRGVATVSFNALTSMTYRVLCSTTYGGGGGGEIPFQLIAMGTAAGAIKLSPIITSPIIKREQFQTPKPIIIHAGDGTDNTVIPAAHGVPAMTIMPSATPSVMVIDDHLMASRSVRVDELIAELDRMARSPHLGDPEASGAFLGILASIEGEANTYSMECDELESNDAKIVSDKLTRVYASVKALRSGICVISPPSSNMNNSELI